MTTKPTARTPRKKLIFPLYLRKEQAEEVETAKRLDHDGVRLRKPQSRSQFMRDAVLAEARRRNGLARKK